MKDFKKLKIWQQGMNIVDKVYDMSEEIPNAEKFGITIQMTRSAVSIPSNIAEGSAKKSGKDYVRYLEMSLGSSFELETQSLIVERRGWIGERRITELIEMIRLEQKMLQSFIQKLT